LRAALEAPEALRHHVTKVLPYRPDQLFDLVGDVARYPEFVPWIVSMRVFNPVQEGEGVSRLDAEAGVGFSFLKERFTTRVRRDRIGRRIDVSLLSGPFKHLQNGWSFLDHPSGTQIEFDIDFKFKSRLLEALLAANFGLAVGRLMACFEARARQLYQPALSSSDP
jgi:coenzyme Q-binding protein COQ10